MWAERTSGGATGTPIPFSRTAPVIERAPLPIIEVEGSAHVVSYVNSAFCSLLGKSRAELVGRAFVDIVAGVAECVPILDRVYKTGEGVTLPLMADVDENPHWLYAVWPSLDANERPVGVIIQLAMAPGFRQSAAAINEALLISGLRQHELTANAVTLNAQLEKEIAERKLAEVAVHEANARLADQAAELERLVIERTEKLRETVGELEGFSYSVAHDMRAPLRGMQGFAQILLEEHSEQLAPEARTYLDRIASSAARLDLLIQDVLSYTRVLRGDAVLTSVDLSKLVSDIVATYPEWQPPRAEIQIAGILPQVLGHAGFLTQCISNLLSNAVKFVAPGVVPHVRIWAEDRGASGTQTPWPIPMSAACESGADDEPPVVRVWFENNGIGISSEDHTRIFRMFERVNPEENFEGTGIGLTIARKAVERMGGRMDFESEPGKGSRFWVELRKVRTADAVS